MSDDTAGLTEAHAVQLDAIADLFDLVDRGPQADELRWLATDVRELCRADPT